MQDRKIADVKKQAIEQIKLHRALLPKRKRRLTKPPRWLHPINVERSYYKMLESIVKIMEHQVKTLLIPQLSKLVNDSKQLRPDSDDIRLDDYVEELKQIFMRISFNVTNAVPNGEDIANRVFKAVSEYNYTQFSKIAKAVLGVDVFIRQPWLLTELKLFVQTNAALIKTIPQQGLDRVQQTTLNALRSGTRAETIAEGISQSFGVTYRRAKVIARDQVGKLNGQLTQLRQNELGINEYIWRTSEDERVRGDPDGKYPNAEPSHYARNGKKFSWNDPPEGGHPGDAILCRCYSEPVFGNLINESNPDVKE